MFTDTFTKEEREGFLLECEEKKKKNRLKNISYTHFDYRVTIDRCWEEISNPDKIVHHSFYPLIHFTKKSRRVDNSQDKMRRKDDKVREIYYAAHIDSWIYRYYCYLLNLIYNKRLEVDGLNDVAVAYRTNLHKSNVNFAKEAFTFIRNCGDCYIMVGDYTNFFDNLDHKYLKKEIKSLLETSEIPVDLYAVLKSLMRFSYVELEDLVEHNGLKYTLRKKKKFDDPSKYKTAIGKSGLRDNRELIKPGYAKLGRRGIPQGTPLSAVCANIYMLDADKDINDFVTKRGGLYMRYSDDFIVIIPKCGTSNFLEDQVWIKKCILNGPGVELQDEKTKLYECVAGKIVNCTNVFISGGAKGKNILDFLGFSFDGTNVRIRSKTIGKFYNNMYRTIRLDNKNERGTKRVYRKFSERGSANYLKEHNKINTKQKSSDLNRGNFHDYVNRAEQVFEKTEDKTSVGMDTKHVMQKIKKAVDEL